MGIRPQTAQQRGFTLVELMVVVTITGILATLGMPHFKAYLLDARLSDAEAHLANIAARNRLYRIENGKYCCDGDPLDENTLANELRANVEAVGDFCFVMVCKDADLCTSATAPSYIAPKGAGSADIEFEVWAILRESATGNITGPNNATCKIHPDKRIPTGLARAAGSTEAGRQGQAVVLRYPPPKNGVHVATGTDGHRYAWNAGLSKTHALHP